MQGRYRAAPRGCVPEYSINRDVAPDKPCCRSRPDNSHNCNSRSRHITRPRPWRPALQPRRIPVNACHGCVAHATAGRVLGLAASLESRLRISGWGSRRAAGSYAAFAIHRSDRRCGIVRKRKQSNQLAFDAVWPVRSSYFSRKGITQYLFNKTRTEASLIGRRFGDLGSTALGPCESKVRYRLELRN